MFGNGTLRTAWAALLLLSAACEPADTGGGAGSGGRLALVRGGALVVSQDSGANESTFTDANTSAEPAFSPNGQTIALVYSPDTGSSAQRGIYQAGVADRQLVKLAMPTGSDTFASPTWNRSGDIVYFVSRTTGGATTLMQVAKGGTQAAKAVDLAPAGLDHPAAVTDGEFLVTQNGALKTLDIGTGVLTDQGAAGVGRGAVSSDGRLFAYALDEGGGRIAVREFGSSLVTRLTSSGGTGDRNPCFSPDGALVAFESASKIHTARVTGDGPVTPLQSGNDIAWGPAGP